MAYDKDELMAELKKRIKPFSFKEPKSEMIEEIKGTVEGFISDLFLTGHFHSVNPCIEYDEAEWKSADGPIEITLTLKAKFPIEEKNNNA